jgi:GT2 family glycosyltransferase
MIALIVINYRKSDLTVNLCETLVRLENREALQIIVVDNAADSASRKNLDRCYKMGLKVDVLHESTNWGYLGGARRGLQHIRERGWKPDWIIVSNSDIEFNDPNFISKLTSVKSSGDIGVLAPDILLGKSGHSQNPYLPLRPQASRMHFYKWIFRFTVTCFVYQMLGLMKSIAQRGTERQSLKLNAGKSSSTDIYAGHGAFMIFSKAYFDRGGNFEHKPFLFGEEITVAENCRRLKLKVRYEPSLKVTHMDHGSIGWFPSRSLLNFQREASKFCAETYFSKGHS